MLRWRVISAIFGIPLIIGAAWYGGLVLMFLVMLIVIKGVFEMLRLQRGLSIYPNIFLTLSGSLTLLGVAYLKEWSFAGIVFTILVIAHLLLMVVKYPKYKFQDAAAGMFTTIYMSLFAYIYLLSTLPDGNYWLLLMIASTWTSDTFAYFAGSNLGKRKLAPDISPNKTIEGAVGGLIGAVIGTLIMAYIFFDTVTTSFFFVIMLLLGILIAVLSQLGDLVASSLKRQAKIKDAGTVIPGHGGVLDRFDSMLLSAPLVYYFAVIFIIY